MAPADVLDPSRPFGGKTAWLITDGKTGLDVQVRGVAAALGAIPVHKYVRPKGMWKLAAPLGWIDPLEKIGESGSGFAPPWPSIAIGAGVASVPYLKAVRLKAGPGVFTVAVQKTKSAFVDLVAAPVHDRCRGPNVVEVPTAPHAFSVERIARLRSAAYPSIDAFPKPRVAVLLGGSNAVYRFQPDDYVRLSSALASLGALGASFFVTPSRRTQPELREAALAATAARPRLVWGGEGENPYPFFLAHADAFVVTADSVNMTGEAAATGKPIFVFRPSGGSAKFERFHEALKARGVTRTCPHVFRSIPSWDYAPLDSAKIIADEIERRWSRRARLLPGLVRA